MRIPRIYLPDLPGLLSPGSNLPLPKDRAHYLQRVLRLRAGAALIVFNGDGGQFEARLTDAGHLQLGEHQAVEHESPLQVTLIQGISRGERMEFTLRKATELGVGAIQPITSARCEVRLKGERLAKRMHHWRGIIASACEQCGRNRLPTLSPLLTLEQAVQTAAGLRLLLLPGAERGLGDLPPPTGPVSLLVGPEGGLDQAEIATARNTGFIGLRLGPRVLRTETAPLAALAAMQALWGDL